MNIDNWTSFSDAELLRMAENVPLTAEEAQKVLYIMLPRFGALVDIAVNREAEEAAADDRITDLEFSLKEATDTVELLRGRIEDLMDAISGVDATRKALEARIEELESA